MLKGMAFKGYRSFGDTIQYLDGFSKLNVFIGRNNSGKSNVLRIVHDVYPLFSKGDILSLGEIDRHMPSRTPFQLGIPYRYSAEGGHPNLEEPWNAILKDKQRDQRSDLLASVFRKKSELDKTDGAAWAFIDERGTFVSDGWIAAFEVLDNDRLYNLWRSLMGGQAHGGDRKVWIAHILSFLEPRLESFNSAMIPAIRQIGAKGSPVDGYGGSGLIERLSQLESPGVLHQEERKKFDQINLFVSNVTENSSARITVPYERDTILVHMDDKVLPLESLGSGLHEVIILAAASTLLENQLVCMEEPELHLNPVLQKKLIRYISSATSNQYFISTHSASFIDAPDTTIFHVTQDGTSSSVTRALSTSQRSSVCEDLGYHPSDLLQTNCIIWVEGPSDRLYLNWWLQHFSPDLIEGVHYSVMFYGGRLLSHLSNDDVDELLDDFISLRSLNRRGAILIDSDKQSALSRINATKKRLKEEFDGGPGFAWITAGREIENYLSSKMLADAIANVHKSAKPLTEFGKFENTLLVQKPKAGRGQVSKVDVAKWVVQHQVEPDVYDLRSQMKKLVEFIRKSNPQK